MSESGKTEPEKAKASPSKRDPKTLDLHLDSKESDGSMELARAALRPTVQAAMTAQAFSPYGTSADRLPDLMRLVDELAAQAKQSSDGNLARQEAMLVAQSHTLDAIFHSLARRAALNMGEYVNAADTYMRLALRAQSQCRSTIEALAEIKNPKPVAFVQQANISNGPQQVNNGINGPVRAQARARAGEIEKQPNELLEVMPASGMTVPTPVQGVLDEMAASRPGDEFAR